MLVALIAWFLRWIGWTWIALKTATNTKSSTNNWLQTLGFLGGIFEPPRKLHHRSPGWLETCVGSSPSTHRFCSLMFPNQSSPSGTWFH